MEFDRECVCSINVVQLIFLVKLQIQRLRLGFGAIAIGSAIVMFLARSAGSMETTLMEMRS